MIVIHLMINCVVIFNFYSSVMSKVVNENLSNGDHNKFNLNKTPQKLDFNSNFWGAHQKGRFSIDYL